MTDQHDDAEALIARADDLEARMSDPDFVALFDYSKRTRRVVRACVALTAAFAVLAAVVGFVVVKASENADDIAQAKVVARAVAEAAVTTCEAANESRAGQTELWSFIFGLTRNDSPQVDEAKAIVARIFAPRDCALPTGGDTSP